MANTLIPIAEAFPGIKGMGGHQSPRSETEVWLTPPDIFRDLGAFDLDPCAADPRPWDCARVNYTRADNGLLKPWDGRVWLNPPYGPPSIVRPWLERMAAHQRGVALIFARTETEAFHRFVWQAAHGVLFLRGRLHFCRPDGRPADNNAGAPSCLVAYSLHDRLTLEESNLPGHTVTIYR